MIRVRIRAAQVLPKPAFCLLSKNINVKTGSLQVPQLVVNLIPPLHQGQQQSTALALPRGTDNMTSRSRGQQRPNLRVLPRSVTPKPLSPGAEGTPKRMKVNIPTVGDSPAPTLTTLSLRSSALMAVSSESRYTKSSGARSTGASTTIRKLVMDDKSKKQTLNIFVADLYNENHLFELYCSKNNPSKEDKDDFLKAPFPAKLHDVLQGHTPSENKCAYAKLCSKLGVYCDADKVTTNKKIKVNLKDLVLSHYEELK